MGSGSSRSGRALRRLRGPDSRPAGSGGAAPEGGTGATGPPASATAGAGEEVPEAAAAAAAGATGPDPGPDPGPAAPSDGRDETLRLLDQLLAESAAWAPGEPAPRRPARPPPAAGAGSRVSPEHRAEDPPESRSASKAPGSSQERPERPERRSVILYDCSEEELMASIEQEYCH